MNNLDDKPAFSGLSANELIALFQDDETANEASDYIAGHYDKFKDIIRESISSDDSAIAEYSVMTAGKAQDSVATSIIRPLLKSDYPNVVKAALQVLGWLWDDESREEFYTLLTSDDPEISSAAAASIAMVSDDFDTKRLEAICTSPQAHIRIAVAGTLALINGEESFQILEKMLEKESDPDVKIFLVRKISYFNMPKATKILVSYLDDNDLQVQEAAAAGLSRTGLRGYEDNVLKKVSSNNIWVSYFAVKALGTSCGEKSAKTLIDAYKTKDNNIRLAIIEALSLSEYDSSVFLASLLIDSNEDIRKEAISALGVINSAEAVENAYELLEKDPSWLVRYKALDILDKLRPDGYKTHIKNHRDSNKYIQNKINDMLGGENDK